MKETFYFSHDADARHDKKILRLKAKYGIEGYGIYFIILEMLRLEAGYKLSLDDVDVIAIECMKDSDFVSEFLEFCFSEKVKLFEKDKEYFWSDSMKSRMQIYEDKKNKLKENGKKGGRPSKEKQKDIDKKPEENQKVLEEKPEGFENETKKNQSKVNKNKINESKVNNLEEEAEEEKNDFQIFGEYENVFLTDQDHKKLETEIISKDKLCEFIEVLSLRIETGKENDHIAKGKGHLARIRDIYKYRKKFPEKFIKKEGGKKNAASSKGRTDLDKSNTDGWSL